MRRCSRPPSSGADPGRYGIPELFKLKDRNGREYVLPLTHEETVTFHARELQSYRQLPQILVPLPDRRSATSRARAAASCASASSS